MLIRAICGYSYLSFLVFGDFGFDDFAEAAEWVVAVLVVNAVEDALVELAVLAPDVMAVGDGFSLVVGRDDGLGVAVVEVLVSDDPVVPIALADEAESFGIVVVVDLGFVVDGDQGVATEIVVGVGGFLEEMGCWGGDRGFRIGDGGWRGGNGRGRQRGIDD